MFVEIDRLSKTYGRFSALDDCSLSIDTGEVFGLLGPNGAGKSTLLRLLIGFLKPSSGTARIASLDCCHESHQIRKLVSYLPGDVRLFNGMRSGEVVRLLSELRGDYSPARVCQLAEELDVDLSKRVSQLSTGTRQKLALVCVFAAKSQLLVLDEPTANLDPTVRIIVSRLVQRAKSNGQTVILSSHVLSEVEAVCDRVAIMRSGRVAHVQQIGELRRRHRIRVTAQTAMLDPPAWLHAQLDVLERSEGELVIETGQNLMPILRWLSDLNIDDLRIESAGLHSVFERFHPSTRQFGSDASERGSLDRSNGGESF